MIKKQLNILSAATVILFFLSHLSGASMTVNTQDKDAIAFKHAYNLVLEEKWEEAHENYNIRKYKKWRNQCKI